jgi:hypothetical protein
VVLLFFLHGGVDLDWGWGIEGGDQLVFLHGGVDLDWGWGVEGGDQLVLVHGGVVGHCLASWGSLHLDWVDISLNADFSYTVNIY